MSVKGNGRGSYQGWGVHGVWVGWVGLGRGRDTRWYSYSEDTHKHKGLHCSLGIHVFDYGKLASAYWMKTTC